MPAPAQQPTGIAFELATGGVAQVAGSPTRLRVASIADSRCPSDVTCVWAGDAVVVIVRSGAGESRSDTLHLRAEPHAVAGVGGEWVELLDVRPYPRSTETSPVRVAVLRVRRGQ